MSAAPGRRVVVLGAGVIGTASTWYLQKAGYEVTVVERQSGPALETSWGNGSVIHVSEVEPWSQPGMPRKILGWLGKEDAPLLVRYGALPHILRWGYGFIRNSTAERFRANMLANLSLAMHSLESLHDIVAETGVSYDRGTNGVLKIYRDRDSLEGATRRMEELSKHGLLHEQADAARCVALEPALAETQSTLVGGLYFPRDEVGDCRAFTTGVAEACAKRGVNYRYDTTVTELEVRNGRVTGVRTDKGLIEADNVVVALGSFTAPMLRKIGIYVPIYPVKGVTITFDRGEWTTGPRMPVIDDSRLFGLVPIGDRMRISGSAEVAGYDAIPSPTRGGAIAANAAFTFPEMKDHYRPETSRLWAGLRPVTPSGRPLIGATPIAGLWVNAGHGHLGWTFSCGSGRALADLVAGRDPGVPVSAGFEKNVRAG